MFREEISGFILAVLAGLRSKKSNKEVRLALQYVLHFSLRTDHHTYTCLPPSRLAAANLNILASPTFSGWNIFRKRGEDLAVNLRPYGGGKA